MGICLYNKCMRILITAGPTREAIDPVRYITNKSSGKMGYSLAAAAVHEGHKVLLISGPTSLEIPNGVDYLPVESAEEMYEAVQNQIGRMDAAIMTAAVADYKPINVPEHKIKKTGDTLTLTLEKTKDILGSMRSVFGFEGILIGFAAETNDVESYARGKLEKKQCDMVVANDVSRKDIGFDVAENEVILVYPTYTDHLEKAAKTHIAHEIIKRLPSLHRQKSNNL